MQEEVDDNNHVKEHVQTHPVYVWPSNFILNISILYPISIAEHVQGNNIDCKFIKDFNLVVQESYLEEWISLVNPHEHVEEQ